MRKKMLKTGLILLLIISLFCPIAVLAQTKRSSTEKPKRRPALIRDDRTQQPEEYEEEVFKLDPVKARKSYEIAEYYLKGKHYDAALMRFREAIKYKPDFDMAKLKFIHTLEKKEDWENVVEFTSAYLQAPDMKEHENKLRKSLKNAEKKLQKLNLTKVSED